jgi:hypothetical protein
VPEIRGGGSFARAWSPLLPSLTPCRAVFEHGTFRNDSHLLFLKESDHGKRIEAEFRRARSFHK